MPCPVLRDHFAATSSWTSPNAGGSVPTARHFHSASFYKNSMYLFGGIAGKQGSLEDLCRLVPGAFRLLLESEFDFTQIFLQETL
jgi:hypothetical protein